MSRNRATKEQNLSKLFLMRRDRSRRIQGFESFQMMMTIPTKMAMVTTAMMDDRPTVRERAETAYGTSLFGAYRNWN
jgi:hypothetical protein